MEVDINLTTTLLTGKTKLSIAKRKTTGDDVQESVLRGL